MPVPFINWARTVRTWPDAWARPADETAVRALVRDVRARRGRLRVCGARHSWSAIAAGHDLQVSLDRLDRVLAIDRDARTITVQGGCPLHAINAALAAHGLAMPILGSIAQQTIAGAIATGTHGSSLRHGNLATLARRIRLVDGRGDIHEFNEHDPQLLNAARVHLGALGVITEVTLDVVPAFALIETLQKCPIDQVAADLPRLAAAHEFLKVWWFPGCRDVGLFTLERCPPGPRASRLAAAWDWLASEYLFPGVLSLTRLAPAAILPINRGVDRLHLRPRRRLGRSDEIFLLAVPPRHRETELALPAEHAGAALLALRDDLESTGARLDFIQELRFVRGDDGWMSPAHARDTCQLGMYATHSPDTDRAFARFAEHARRWHARPHWGKEFAASHDEITALYPKAPEFRALARRLDPAGVLRNPLLDVILGPL